MGRIDRAFFERDTVQVARDLLGCVLVRQTPEGISSGRIVETEAYHGWDDRASHAHRGMTPRTRVMFGPAGFSYVYLVYGIHWLLNVIAKPAGVDYGAAVLIRAIEPLEGLQYMARNRAGRKQIEWTNGPGRLTLALQIDGMLNGRDMTARDSPLYFEQGDLLTDEHITAGPRVGINVDEPWKSIPWRFWVTNSRFVSKRA